MDVRRCPTACTRRGVKEVRGDQRHQFVAGVHVGHVDLHVRQDAVAGAREGHGAGHQVRPPAPLDARGNVLAQRLHSRPAPAQVSGLSSQGTVTRNRHPPPDPVSKTFSTRGPSHESAPVRQLIIATEQLQE